MDIDLQLIRQSGRILAETLVYVESFVRPGVSASSLASRALEVIASYPGAFPAFLGYKGYPAAACVSVNNEVVHAIPLEARVLQEGDIVSVDCGVRYFGHFTDACRTFVLPGASQRTEKLVKITQESLDLGIAAAHAGAHVGDISFAIQRHVERHRFNVSLDYTGHGIGLVLHGDPQVPNFGPPGTGDLLRVGTCLAIEPVVFDGPTDVLLGQDGWTVRSRAGNLSAHFEDTIIITEDGPEIATRIA